MQDVLRQLEAVAQPTERTADADSTERNQDFHRLLARETLVSRAELPRRDREGAGPGLPARDRSLRQRDRPLEEPEVRPGAGGAAVPRPGLLPARLPAPHDDLRRRGRRRARRGRRRDRPELRPAGHRAGADRNGRLRVRRRLAWRARSPTRTSTSSSDTRTSRRCRRCAAALARGHDAPADAATIGRDQDGTEVLSAFQTIESLGWHVFVEEPLSEAFAPLESAIWRTALLLVAFLLLAIATSVLLARRLVRPIESIQAAAAKIGAGALDQRIDDHERATSWARSPRSSTAWRAQLEESYAGLEQKVEERTAGARDGARRARREEPRARDGEPAQVASSSRTCRTSCGRR